MRGVPEVKVIRIPDVVFRIPEPDTVYQIRHPDLCELQVHWCDSIAMLLFL